MKIAILDDYQNVALRLADWSGLGGPPTVFHDNLKDADALVQRLAPFDIIVAMRERTHFPGSLLERLPGLKLLVTTGMWNAAIDMRAAERLGITVCGTRMMALSTSELVWGLILALARKIPQEDAAVRAGRWQTTIGSALCGKRLGIVGLGHLGQRAARIARAFDMEVAAWSPNLTAERAAAGGADYMDRRTLFAESDFITVHMVLSERTRRLIGAEDFAVMKPTACLINTSRGPLVDTEALVAALAAGRIGGAGLDVFDVEPLAADHPLRRLDNVILTPHIGYVTEEDYRIGYGDAVEDIRGFLAGAPPRRLSVASGPGGSV
jgi:phosphoglycerate dehydrogenase-like enzyme